MSEAASEIQTWLESYLTRQGAVAGTVHRHVRGGLELAAAVNIPEKVLRVVQWVPRGKGMAGLALERGEPVQTCNLQEADSAEVRPGARAVEAQGAVALPVYSDDGQIRAVVGIAFAEERDFSDQDLARFLTTAGELPAGE